MYWYSRRMLYIKLSALALGLLAAVVYYFIFR
jgi:hypothetical protein